MIAALACIAYLVASVVAFARWPVRHAILATYLGGLLLLPVGFFPPAALATDFPWFVTGTAVPSSMLLTKSWAAALVAVVGAAIRDRQGLRRWRPAPIDAAMLGWCLWPLVGIATGHAAPAPLLSTLYLAGCWGLPWLIGRIWFQERSAQIDLAAALALAALACLPFALIEGVSPLRLYDHLYGHQPFGLDGIGRYIGYRPLGLFEHGNQYGIWVALGALAALWVASIRGKRWRPAAALAVAIAVASQSVGAIALLLAGVALLLGWRARWLRGAAIAAALAIAALGAVHLSGIVPVRTIVRTTPIGQQALALVRSTGRGSIAWRISQDTKTLAAIHDAPWAGAQRWDWFMPFGTRPWGLVLLVIGQFGLIGCALGIGTLAVAAGRALARQAHGDAWHAEGAALVLGTIVLLALGDALLNAFFYFPAIVCAGAIAHRSVTARRADAGLAASGRRRDRAGNGRTIPS